jgi:hypothetical protein
VRYFERTFVFHGYRFAIRGGVNNLVGALDYRHFYGNEGRHVVFRLRFFGRTAGKRTVTGKPDG